jgi:hypothetical protein
MNDEYRVSVRLKSARLEGIASESAGTEILSMASIIAGQSKGDVTEPHFKESEATRRWLLNILRMLALRRTSLVVS